MNCEQYREAIAADPSFDGEAAHLNECAACQSYRAEMRTLDKMIGRALALKVPPLKIPDLPDSETDNVVSLPARRVPPVWLAVAATIALVAVFGVRNLSTDIEYESLADQVLAHLDGEPMGLRVTDVAITDERLYSVVPANVAHMDHDAGLITYAQSCDINGNSVPHLVIQGEHGPITILLMPREYVAEAIELKGQNVSGVILPVGDGSIAIIGSREENLERVQQNVLKSVMWST